jgi:hypothetical protein
VATASRDPSRPAAWVVTAPGVDPARSARVGGTPLERGGGSAAKRSVLAYLRSKTSKVAARTGRDPPGPSTGSTPGAVTAHAAPQPTAASTSHCRRPTRGAGEPPPTPRPPAAPAANSGIEIPQLAWSRISAPPPAAESVLTHAPNTKAATHAKPATQKLAAPAHKPNLPPPEQPSAHDYCARSDHAPPARREKPRSHERRSKSAAPNRRNRDKHPDSPHHESIATPRTRHDSHTRIHTLAWTTSAQSAFAKSTPETCLLGPALLGLMSNAKISVGIASVAQALGISTMPLMRPSTGAVPKIA